MRKKTCMGKFDLSKSHKTNINTSSNMLNVLMVFCYRDVLSADVRY